MLSRELDYAGFRDVADRALKIEAAQAAVAAAAAGEAKGSGRASSGNIARFKDFQGQWHEASNADSGEVAIYEDLEISTQMRFYLVMAKGSGVTLWFTCLGTLLQSWPAGVPGGWLVCGAAATAFSLPPAFWACLKLRRYISFLVLHSLDPMCDRAQPQVRSC